MSAPPAPAPRSAAFDLARLHREHLESGRPYHEFLRVPALSLGLYSLAAGAHDPQQPHAQDEVYVVLTGRARLRVGSREHAVEPGSAVFVAAHAPHAFHAIEEDLSVLVMFAPAEDDSAGSAAQGAQSARDTTTRRPARRPRKRTPGGNGSAGQAKGAIGRRGSRT